MRFSFFRRSWFGSFVFLATKACFICNVEGQISEPALQKSYAHREDTAASQLIGEIAGADSAAFYRDLPRAKKGTFLHAFWQAHNPLVLKYYYGYHLDQRRFSVSDAYFEQKKLLPKTYWAGAVPPDSTQVVEAVQICTRLLTHNPEDAVAMCALGYLNLEQNRESEAEKLFVQALEHDKRLFEARNGRALSLLRVPKQRWRARKLLLEAMAWDRKYSAAYYGLAMCDLIMKSVEAENSLKRLIKRSPEYSDAYFKLGVFYETRGKFEKAEDAYDKQLEADPSHITAQFRLGIIAFKTGQPAHAIEILQPVLKKRPDLQRPALPMVFEAYIQLKNMPMAEATAVAYLDGLDEHNRSMFEDIRIVASPEEIHAFNALPIEERAAYIRAFWQHRDPTPATPENEWLVEHIRRIMYARRHFFSSRGPWDRRGEIYIRYGHPAHWSRSDNIRFEIDPEVVRVKERLLMSLTDDARKELVANIQRIRTSVRQPGEEVDLEPGVFGGTVELTDFENVDYSPRVTPRGTPPQIVRGRITSDTPLSDRDAGIGTDHSRGYPLFPVDGYKPWEYWIYPEVNGGIEIVFTSLARGGDFDYPIPSSIRAEARDNAVVWNRHRPEDIVNRAVAREPSRFDLRRETLDFYADMADFRGEQGQTRLEIYYGLPVSGQPETTQFERGLALFDTTWTPIFQKVEPLSDISDQTDKIVDRLTVNIPPGRYYLGVQVHDTAGNRLGVQKQAIDVESYTGDGLMLSDIELANRIEEQEADSLNIIPQPSKSFSAGQPVTIYYEIYGLKKDAFGQTRYQMHYRIAPAQGQAPAVRVLQSVGKLLGVLSEKEFTVSYEQVGETESELSYLEIDVTDSAQGLYELVVKISDLNANVQVAKSTTFQIVE
ncbi:MAG: GWxTD domain-containing protein [Gemmatimonadetes bacterium]|nr:GWxTD domain-containing protein [Gemmatimonadota bacterium]